MKSLGKNDKSGRSARRGPSSDRPTSPAQVAAAKRRAVVMGILSAALAVVLTLAVVGLVPRWAPIVLAVVVLTYVIAASMTFSRRSVGADRRSMADDASLEYGMNGYDDEYDDEFESEFEGDYREVAYADRVADVAYPRSRGSRPTSKRVRDAQMAAAMDDFLSWDPWEAEQSEEGWSAVPTTLPTYVNAPRATRVRRPIERDRDWSGQAMVEVARTMRRPRITVDDLDDDRYELGSTPHEVASSEDTAELPSLGYEETRRAAGE